MWQFMRDEIVQVRNPCGCFDSCVVDILVRDPKSNIVSDRIIRQENLLRNVSEALIPRTYIYMGNLNFIDHEPTAIRKKEAEDYISQSGFP